MGTSTVFATEGNMNSGNQLKRDSFHHRLVGLYQTLLCVGATAVGAATITVTNTADSGAGSLRAALASAANGDTIDFSVTTPATITLTSGELLVPTNVTILGPGLDNLAINGNYPLTTNRVFHIAPLTTVTIAGVTITNAATAGGGIYNDGVGAPASLLIINSTITGNTGENAGGIFNNGESGGDASVRVVASTLSFNAATTGGLCGGIYNDGTHSGTANVEVATCSLSSNTSTAYAGGIYSAGNQTGNATLTVNASTFSGNSASQLGGGIVVVAGDGISTLDIGDTILNAGASGVNLYNLGGTITSHGYNLSSDDGGGFLAATGDQINTDPMLGPLQDNGGPTFTHALLTGSPAIDQGKRAAIASLALNTDQRGLPRPVDIPGITNATGGDGSEIGAFEVQASAASIPIVLTNPQKLGNGAFQFSFTNTPGASFTVLTTTNLALALSNWTTLGAPAELASGHFQFTDPQATNHSAAFYGVKSP
jgi:hypothetical protein